MTVLCETAPGVVRDTELANAVADRLRQRLGVAVDVELAGPGETAELTQLTLRQKPIRLIDQR